MTNEKSSQIISLMKMYAIIGVVFIHAPKVVESPLVDLVSKHIPMACVSMFFMISGYFLFQKKIEHINIAITEIRKRTRTLLIPFLFWNLFVLILSIAAMKIAPSISNGGPYTIKDWSFGTIVSAVFGVNRYPVNYQFWFIRNLMAFVLFSPILKHLAMKSPLIGFALALAIDQILSGVLFFYLGGLVAMYVYSDQIFEMRNVKFTIGLSLCVFFATFFMQVPRSILLCASFSLLIGLSNVRIRNAIIVTATSSLSSSIFFIYATHEPTITVLERLCRKIPAQSYVFKHVEFISLPIISIALTWLAALAAKRFANKVYLMSTGSR